MSMGEDQNTKTEKSYISSRVDLNHLMVRIREEEKKNKRSNVVISAAVISAVTVFGIMLTL